MRAITLAGVALSMALSVSLVVAPTRAQEATGGETGTGDETATATGAVTGTGDETGDETTTATTTATGAATGAVTGDETTTRAATGEETATGAATVGDAGTRTATGDDAGIRAATAGGGGSGGVTRAAPAGATVTAAVGMPRAISDAGAPFSLGATLERRWYTDAGYDVFAGDDVSSRLGFWLAYDLIALGRDVIVAAELGWGMEHDDAEGLLGGILRSELASYSPHAGAQLRWVMLPWLQPHLRLQGGATFWKAEIFVRETELDNGGVVPSGSAALGVLVRTPTRLFENSRGGLASLSLGLLLEGGYAAEAPWAMTADADGPGKDDIPIAEGSLGELERSGPFVRVSVVGRY